MRHMLTFSGLKPRRQRCLLLAISPVRYGRLTPESKHIERTGNAATDYPPRWFVYNLSPSFNWAKFGFSDADLKNFVWDLGKEGFVLQLISLAGLHANAVSWGTCRILRL